MCGRALDSPHISGLVSNGKQQLDYKRSLVSPQPPAPIQSHSMLPQSSVQVYVHIILTVMFPLMSVFTGANAVGLSVSEEENLLSTFQHN